MPFDPKHYIEHPETYPLDTLSKQAPVDILAVQRALFSAGRRPDAERLIAERGAALRVAEAAEVRDRHAAEDAAHEKRVAEGKARKLLEEDAALAREERHWRTALEVGYPPGASMVAPPLTNVRETERRLAELAAARKALAERLERP